MATSTLTQLQKDNLTTTVTNLKHKKAVVYLGVLINLKQLSVGYTGVGQDVAHRASKAKAMITIMAKKGLKRGAVALLPGLHIIRSTALASITYGLSAVALTQPDKHTLNTTIANAIAHLLNLQAPTTNDQTEWLLYDLDVTPPTVQININDCTSLLKAVAGSTDLITSALLPEDEDLNNSVNVFLHSILTTRDQVQAIRPTSRTKYLVARHRSIKSIDLSPSELEITQGPLPILHRHKDLSPAHQTALITARYGHCFPTSNPCPRCNQITSNTNHHSLWSCPALAHVRDSTLLGPPSLTALIMILNGHDPVPNQHQTTPLKHALELLYQSQTLSKLDPSTPPATL
jgi:hypothetical protein